MWSGPLLESKCFKSSLGAWKPVLEMAAWIPHMTVICSGLQGCYELIVRSLGGNGVEVVVPVGDEMKRTLRSPE